MCSTRCRRPPGGAGLARAARSKASSVIRTPPSPMAWMKICQPRASSSRTMRSSSGAVIVGHAVRGRVVDIRRQHRRGVGLDDAVHHQLHGADLEPLVAADPPADGVEPVGVGLAEAWRHRQRRVDAQRQLARGAGLFVERELVLAAAGVLDAGHAQRMGARDARGQRAPLLRPGGCGHHLADEALGRLLEQAVRLAGAGSSA